MPISKDVYLRPLVEADLIEVLEWRNHTEVRRWMRQVEPIQLNEHLNWFEQHRDREDSFFYIFEYAGCPHGYVSLQRINYSDVYEWGFYLKPNAQNGLGMLFGATILNFVFKELKIKKIFAEVLSFNERSIKLHHKLGFAQEGVLRQQFKDDRGEFDIVQFGLIQSEWSERNK